MKRTSLYNEDISINDMIVNMVVAAFDQISTETRGEILNTLTDRYCLNCGADKTKDEEHWPSCVTYELKDK